MGAYPNSDDDRRVPLDAVAPLATAIFAACGMPQARAAIVAESLVQSDLRGAASHGLMRIPEYVGKLRGGGIDPRGEPRVARDSGAALVVDGGNSMGQIAARFGMERAIDRARTTGVAVAAVRGSNHCGALAPYAAQAIDAGQVGIAISHTLPVMAPWGSIDKILGISPIAIGIPARDETAILLDVAFSEAAVGKIKIYQHLGLTIPPEWAYDVDGIPTTDPAAAIAGLLHPIGGHKGSGLALALGVITALLSGGLYGTELGNVIDGPVPGGDSQLLLALDIAAFTDPDEFRGRVDRIVRQVRESRPAPGFAGAVTPGASAAAAIARNRRDGLALTAETVRSILAAADALGVDAADLRAAAPID
jgi:LDH2 family malate/lactate/ureidoglycolate dehydrogenase